MSQDVIELETSLAYLLKEASSALRSAMDAALRPFGMSVTHYACLELLAQRPGSSNSELARGAFVTRQSMNVLLQSLEQDGSVTRPAESRMGRVLPAELTTLGRQRLKEVSTAVRAVEVKMLGGMTATEQTAAYSALKSMIASLSDDTDTGRDREPGRPRKIAPVAEGPDS
ncbi:MarR family winged helix-turn-helix transcriptional regulator [Microbacterium sp. CIAB417]|uniref:MarR family winged helix-turn-helix transcriptional regulator n=1 Tax=Microbacterium sp. CIAB417 TaxID=2860287 RepID=UPI001FADF082|nr:MarR family transcriptional regulator [Microbacterium sp. CIAB417]